MRAYRGESEDEFFGITCPEDVRQPAERDYGAEADEAYDRIVQQEIDDQARAKRAISDEVQTVLGYLPSRSKL